MLGRLMKKERYDELKEAIASTARSRPLCPIYEIDMTVNREGYTLFVQPERHNKLYALYALRCVSSDGGAHLELITDNLILGSLLEFVVFQNEKRKTKQEGGGLTFCG